MGDYKLKLEHPWEYVKEMLKENDHELTEEDLYYVPGKEDELLERLAKKKNRTREEIKILIESISANDGIAS
jgi:hypothetical protein